MISTLWTTNNYEQGTIDRGQPQELISETLSDYNGALTPFWLAVHGKPVLFWKGTSGLKFPCFLFMHANGTGPFEFRAVPIL